MGEAVTACRAGAGGTGGTAGAALRTEGLAEEELWVPVSELPGGRACTAGSRGPRKEGTSSAHSEVMNG
jgi:hypothetical protein